MTDLSQLLEKVRTAETGSRELDAELVSIFGAKGSHGVPTCAGYLGIANFTSSLDAIVALIERELPGWQYAMGTCNEDDSPWACITEPEELCRDFTGVAPDIVLALVEAFLSALNAKEKADG